MIDYIFETVSNSGYVLYAIFFVSIYAWFLIMNKYFLIIPEKKAVHAFAMNMSGMRDKSELADSINDFEDDNMIITGLIEDILKVETPENMEPEITGKRIFYFQILDRNMGTIGTLAAISPLLGLLGTVIGMIKTFSVIKLYGAANISLMADGISEALITTQAGLIVAFPIMAAHAYLKNRVKEGKDIFEKICLRIQGL